MGNLMMKKYVCLLFLFLLIGSSIDRVPLYAQNLHNFVKITTLSKQTFIGELIVEDVEQVTIKTESVGQIRIERENIKSIEKIDSSRIKNGTYWFDNAHATRYFFAPNGIGLEKGEGYYQNTWVLFNNVNYGISDHISIGGGVIPLFLFGTSETPIWLQPKVTFPIQERLFYVGGGAMIGGVVGVDTEPIGLFYGSATIGNRDKNVSVSLGYGYAGSEIADTPVINISGMTRIARKFYLLSENYIVPGANDGVLMSFGARWVSETIAIDFGLFRPLKGAGGIVGVPWLGVAIPFGK